MSEPTSIRAGDSVSWTRSLDAYKASDGWTLHYRLLHPTADAVAFDATPDGDDHAVDLTATATAAYTAGNATLVAWVTKDTQSVTLGQYPVTILPDLRTTATLDGRTPAEKALADAKTALQTYVANGTSTVMTTTIGDRTTTFRSTRDLVELINQLEIEVQRERAALALLDGTGVPGRVFSRH
jgi:hypothetical protein